MTGGAPGLLVAAGVFVGGGIGAALRHLIDSSVPARVRARFPWGILGINLAGSFLLGLFVGLVLEAPVLSVLGTGALGGFTTFSTASLDTVRMLFARRWGSMLLNGFGALVAATLLAVLGILVGRGMIS